MQQRDIAPERRTRPQRCPGSKNAKRATPSRQDSCPFQSRKHRDTAPGAMAVPCPAKRPRHPPLPFPVSGEPEPQQQWAGIGPDGTGCPFPQATKKGGPPRMSSLRKNQAYRLQGKQAGGRMTGRRDLACQAHLGPDARIAFDELHSTGDLAADPGLIGDLAF